MKMDMGAAIVGIVVILICLIPFVIMYYNGLKKGKKLLQSLNEFAKQQGCTVNQHEICGNMIIGSDTSRSYFFLIKNKGENQQLQYVDLSKIRNCELIKKTRNVNSPTGNITVYERVELEFIPLKRNTEAIRFEFFDERTSIELGGELLFANNWSLIINDHLLSMKK